MKNKEKSYSVDFDDRFNQYFLKILDSDIFPLMIVIPTPQGNKTYKLKKTRKGGLQLTS